MWKNSDLKNVMVKMATISTVATNGASTLVKMQYLFPMTLCHTTNALIHAFIVRFVHALELCKFSVLF